MTSPHGTLYTCHLARNEKKSCPYALNKHRAMDTCVGVEVQLHSFLTSARSSSFYPSFWGQSSL